MFSLGACGILRVFGLHVFPTRVGQGDLHQFAWYLCKVDEIWKGTREEQSQSFMSWNTAFRTRGKIAADTTIEQCSLWRTKATGHFLVDLGHPYIPLRLIVGRGLRGQS